MSARDRGAVQHADASGDRLDRGAVQSSGPTVDPITQPRYGLSGQRYGSFSGKIPLASEAGTIAENGATIPIYGSVREAAFYNAALNMTVFAWEAWDTDHREAQVRTFDHTTGTFGPIVDSGIPGLTDDDHGVPAILQDHEGYGHLFGGAHNSDMQHAVTDAVNDFTAWTLQTDITADYGYPHPVLVGSAIYLFMREGSATGFDLVLVKSASLSGGAATWDAKKELVNLDTAGPTLARVYAGNFVVVGSEIWFIAQEAPSNDSERKHVYFFRYDTVTGDVKNYAGTVTIDAADLPVDRTEADASFRIYEHTGTDKGTDIPVWFLDGNSRAHVFFGVGPNAGPFDVMYMYDTGSGWSTPEAVAEVTGRYDVFAPVLLADGRIQLYYPEAWHSNWRDLDFPLDGEILVKTRSAGGTWGSATKIIQGEANTIGRVVPVKAGHQHAMVMFAELANGNLDSLAGGKRIYAYGDSGFLVEGLTGTAPTITSELTAEGFLGEAFSYQITATGDPASFTYGASNLPDGLSVNTSTGEISGTPTAAVYTADTPVVITADNGVSPPASENLVITIWREAKESAADAIVDRLDSGQSIGALKTYKGYVVAFNDAGESARSNEYEETTGAATAANRRRRLLMAAG